MLEGATMKKILFLAEAVSLAHVGRPLVLAEWAKMNGFEIYFACSDGGLVKTNTNPQEYNLHSLFTINSQLFYDRVNVANFFYTSSELKNYVQFYIKLIIMINPDLIVSDFRLTASISAELMNKPLLNLSNAYWCPNYSCHFPAPEFSIFKYLPQKSSDLLFSLIRPILFKTFGKELNQLREHFGLTRKSDFRVLYTDGTYTAYLYMQDFINLKNLPKNHFYLGPVIWSPKKDGQKIDFKGQNYVYITMGSSGENKWLPLIIAAVLKLNYQIILSGINESEKMELLHTFPQLLGKSIIEPLISAEMILKHCRLTVCHGGSGTVYQSLSHGTPVLCLPKNPDQSLVSMALEEKNLGRFLSCKNTNPLNIKSTIIECLSNEILKENAKYYSKKIQLWDTKSHWNEFLIKFKTDSKSAKEIA